MTRRILHQQEHLQKEYCTDRSTCKVNTARAGAPARGILHGQEHLQNCSSNGHLLLLRRVLTLARILCGTVKNSDLTNLLKSVQKIRAMGLPLN